jgi:hypothetical protein
LFVATNGAEAIDALRSIAGSMTLIDLVNRLVVRQAYRYVYGVCENHLPLVEEHFGLGLPEPWRLHAGTGR